MNIFRREKIVAMQQFLDVDRKPHIYLLTNKRVVEIDYATQEEKQLIATLKEIKQATR